MRKGRAAEAAFVLLFAVATTTVLTHPLVLEMDRVGRINTGDGQLSIWNVAWVARTMWADPAHVFDANIFYPHRNTLAYSEANIGAGVLAMPIWWATKNPFLAHNAVVFLAFILSVTGAYALARHVTGDIGAALFAGVAFAFCPFIYARTAHIQLLMTAGLPWSLWACHRLIEQLTWKRAMALAAVLAAQALSCAYYGIFAGLSVGLAILFFAATRGLWRVPRYWILAALAAAVSIACVLPFFVHYLDVPAADFNRSLEESRGYAANWQTYLASPTYAHRPLLSLIHGWSEVAFPGIAATLLGAAAIVLGLTGRLGCTAPAERASGASRIEPREAVAFYSIFAGLAGWCSLGPAAGLYSVLFYVIPIFGFLRAPGRFGILVALGLVICAAIAIAQLGRGSGRLARLAAPACILFALAELSAMPLPLPVVDPVPHPVYQKLATLPRGPLVEFPYFWTRSDFPRHAYYMLNSTAHWMPLINGYSDHFPDDFRSTVVDLSSFPTRVAFSILRERRARYVVFHLRFYDQRSRERLLERLDDYAEFLSPILKQDDVWLYEITRWP